MSVTVLILGERVCKCISPEDRSVAKPHSLPYQAGIGEMLLPPTGCGGALITPNYVLSSATCLYALKDEADLNSLRVVLGEHDYNATGDGEKYFKIQSRRIHPKFDLLKTSRYDFSLFELAKPVKLSKKINIVCLPKGVTMRVS